MNAMRVALVQMRTKTQISENVRDLEAFVREASAGGANYVQTPEMTGILERNRVNLFSQIKSQEEDLLVQRAAELAAELNVWLHIGSHAIKVGEHKAANRAFIFSPDGVLVNTYDKIHMFDVDLDNGERWRESSVYRAGTVSKTTTINDMCVGLSICYDIRFPQLYREQAVSGAQILTAPSSFTKQTGAAHWHILMRSRAIENGAFMLAAAQVGKHEDGRETYGHSLVVDPWGQIVSENTTGEPGIIFSDLDLGQVAEARKKISNLANSRGFVLESGTEHQGQVA